MPQGLYVVRVGITVAEIFHAYEHVLFFLLIPPDILGAVIFLGTNYVSNHVEHELNLVLNTRDGYSLVRSWKGDDEADDNDVPLL